MHRSEQNRARPTQLLAFSIGRPQVHAMAGFGLPGLSPGEDFYPTATDRRGFTTCASVLMRGRNAFLACGALATTHYQPWRTMTNWADASLSPLEGPGEGLAAV